MRHCCNFKADDVYFLKETSLYTTRKLSIGFCPICNKPITELTEISFNGNIRKQKASGIKADILLKENKEDILYSMQEHNYICSKSKPFGWKFGINKAVKTKNKEITKQYACDFYGNKELIKIT